MKGRTDVRTYVVRTYVRMVDDVMAIKPNFLASMGYQYFLSYGAPRARAFGARGAPLLLAYFCRVMSINFVSSQSVQLYF